MEESQSGRLLRQIREICEIAGVRAEEYTKVTKRRLDVLSLSREMSREKTALGERVFDLAAREDRGDILGDVTVQAILGRLRNLEATLGDCEEEIADIHAAARARASDIRRPAEVTALPESFEAEGRKEPPAADDEFIEEEDQGSVAAEEDAADQEEPAAASAEVPEAPQGGESDHQPRA